MAKGIYKMTNNRTGKVYVGQSNNLTRRKQEHMSKLSKGTHHNKQMQQDFNRGDRFSFQVVEYVNGTRDDLNSREKSQIRNHNSFHGGYNRTSGGDYIPSNKVIIEVEKNILLEHILMMIHLAVNALLVF